MLHISLLAKTKKDWSIGENYWFGHSHLGNRLEGLYNNGIYNKIENDLGGSSSECPALAR